MRRLPILAVAMALALAARGERLRLEQALDEALARHPGVLAAGERLEQRRAAERQALGNFLPTLRLEANAQHLDDDLQFDLSPIRDAMIQLQAANQTEFTNLYGLLQGQPALGAEQRAQVAAGAAAALDGLLPPFVSTLKDQDNVTANLTGVQPLYVGGKLVAGRRAARAESAAAMAELERAQADARGEVERSWLGVLLLREACTVRRDVLEAMREHRADARRLQDEGLLNRVQAMRAEVAVAEAERNLFDEEKRLELARHALRHALGRGGDAPEAEPADSLALRELPGTLEDWLEEARQGQPLLALLEQKRSAAGQKVVAERADMLPRLAAVGRYELLDEDLSALEPRWVVGLRLEAPLFQGFRQAARVGEARHLTREVDQLREGAGRQVDLWVRRAWSQQASARERHTRLEAEAGLARENLALCQARFRTGLGTSLDVVDALLLTEKVRLERLASLHQYYLGWVDLATAAGRPERFVELWRSGEER